MQTEKSLHERAGSARPRRPGREQDFPEVSMCAPRDTCVWLPESPGNTEPGP